MMGDAITQSFIISALWCIRTDPADPVGKELTDVLPHIKIMQNLLRVAEGLGL